SVRWLSEGLEGRAAYRQLVKLGVDAAELARPFLAVTLLDLDAAHRQRRTRRTHRADPLVACLGFPHHLYVDFNGIHALHATYVRVAELLVRVQERARALDTRRRIDHLVAVHLAPAALQLVLRPERELRDGQCLE